MSFRENIIKKMEIDGLAKKILASLKPSGEIVKIDKNSVRLLLTIGDFQRINKRDLELYISPESLEPQEVLVLDNGLTVYRTDIEDVALRKSPTIKEMVSIRNIVKILKDDDVVISRKADSVAMLKDKCIQALDLTVTKEDLDAIRLDGAASLESGYTQGVEEALDIFAELLDYASPPSSFQAAHHKIAGQRSPQASGKTLYGPLFIFSRVHQTLKWLDHPLDGSNQDDVQGFQNIVDGKKAPTVTGIDVFGALMDKTVKKHLHPQ